MNEMAPLGKMLIIGGIAMVIAGLFITFGMKYLPLGRLPGDIAVRRGNFSFFFPVVTCIVISVILSVIMNLFFRR